MPRKFAKLDLAEFTRRVNDFRFTRVIDAVHMHHTFRPNHAGFSGEQSIIAMWRYHTEKNGWSDIAQHVTIDPAGGIWMGRDWNGAPASATGNNGTAQRGPFMIEVVGDFDRGRDTFGGRQMAATLGVIAAVQDRFELPSRSLRFHREFSYKTCPGGTLDLDEIRCEVLALRRGRSRSVAAAAVAIIDPLGCGENGTRDDIHAGARRTRAASTPSENASYRALCVGIDDYPNFPLTGCVRDAEQWAELFLLHGFKVEMLVNAEATRQKVLDALAALVATAEPGHVIAFQFSGHGTLLPDDDGDEATRKDPTPFDDEAVLPYDWKTGAYILDDDLDAILSALPPGATARVFIDACHSGHARHLAGTLPEPLDCKAAARFVRSSDMMIGAHRAFRARTTARPRGRANPAAVAVFSACQSYQVAMEVNGRGVFSAAAERILSNRSDLTNQEFIGRLIESLREEGRQVPVLDCEGLLCGERVLPAYVEAGMVTA